MEEDGPDFDQIDFLEAIQRLFNKLKEFLDREHGFSSFFYPQINLLEGYPKDLITKRNEVAGKVMQQPLDHFPSHFQEICEYLKRIDDILTELEFESCGQFI